MKADTERGAAAAAGQGPAIRRARAADAETVHQLLRALAAGLGKAENVRSTAEDIRRHGFGADPAFEALIAERDGRAVGLCLSFDSFSTWEGCRGVYVQDIYVAETERRGGLGRRLLAAAAARAARRGGRYLRLAVDAENDAARAFYARAGLAVAEAERIYQARGAAFAAGAEEPLS